jgi:hypothetical protein
MAKNKKPEGNGAGEYIRINGDYLETRQVIGQGHGSASIVSTAGHQSIRGLEQGYAQYALESLAPSSYALCRVD